MYRQTSVNRSPDDTFFFSVMHDLDTFACEINVELEKIETLSHQWNFQSRSRKISTKSHFHEYKNQIPTF